MGQTKKVRVLFCCLGNICRSPMAHGVFLYKLAHTGLSEVVEVDSCGTGSWHVGKAPDARAVAEAAKRGYDLTPLRARQVCAEDFETFDYVLAMDGKNLLDLQALCPAGFAGQLALFLSFASNVRKRELPDPYYGADAEFSEVLDLVEVASEGLIQDIQTTL